MGRGKTPDQWDAWTAEQKERHSNGNGHGPSLSIELQRLDQSWGIYEPAIRRWETVTRPAPIPMVGRGDLNPEFSGWMQGYPAGWTDGLGRNAAMKAFGNSVCPQQALAALSVLVPALMP